MAWLRDSAPVLGRIRSSRTASGPMSRRGATLMTGMSRISRLLLLTGALPAILFAAFIAVVIKLPPVLDLFDALVVMAYGAGLVTYRQHARRGPGGRLGKPWVMQAYAVALLFVTIAVF